MISTQTPLWAVLLRNLKFLRSLLDLTIWPKVLRFNPRAYIFKELDRRPNALMSIQIDSDGTLVGKRVAVAMAIVEAKLATQRKDVYYNEKITLNSALWLLIVRTT